MNSGTTARESPTYRAARDRLLEAEIALRRMTETVAEQRRRLPHGPPVPVDYVLQRAGTGASLRLSELFGDGDALLTGSVSCGRRADCRCERWQAGKAFEHLFGRAFCVRGDRIDTPIF